MGYGGFPRPKVYVHKSYFSIQTFVGILGIYIFWKKHTKNIKDFGAHRLDIDNSHAK